MQSGYPDISWHGVEAWNPDWADYSLTLGFLLCGEHVSAGKEPDDYIYVGMNMHWESHTFQLPRLPKGRLWGRFVNTSLPYPNEIVEPGEEQTLADQNYFAAGPRSVFILTGRRIKGSRNS
jgi:glycogen operon protein